MAYLDAPPLRQRIATLGTAGAIELAIAVALVGALSYKFVPDTRPPPPTTFDATPTPTPVPPDPQTTPEPTDSRPTAPIPPTTYDPVPDPIPTPTILDPVPPVPTGGGATLDPPIPPKPAFTPVAAAPANDVSRWVTTDDYPARDLREGNQGTTRFRVVVGSNGRVQSCEVTRTSGFASLDRVVCPLITRRARFNAATDGNGDKVVGTYSSMVKWQIPR